MKFPEEPSSNRHAKLSVVPPTKNTSHESSQRSTWTVWDKAVSNKFRTKVSLRTSYNHSCRSVCCLGFTQKLRCLWNRMRMWRITLCTWSKMVYRNKASTIKNSFRKRGRWNFNRRRWRRSIKFASCNASRIDVSHARSE